MTTVIAVKNNDSYYDIKNIKYRAKICILILTDYKY